MILTLIKMSKELLELHTYLTGIFLDDTMAMVGRTKCLFEIPGPLLPFWCNIFKLRLRDVHELIQISSHGILLEVKTCEV